MSPAHTPAPWRQGPIETIKEGSVYRVVLHGPLDNSLPPAIAYGDTPEQAMRNADLIQAADALLSLAERLQDGTPLEPDDMEDLRHLIACARGTL